VPKLTSAVLSVCCGLSLAACSSGTVTPPTSAPVTITSAPTTTTTIATTTTTSLKTAQSAYLADVAPVNSAINAFGQVANGWTSTTTDTQAESDAQPLLKTLNTLTTNLTDYQWPQVAKSDIRALVTVVANFEGDLQSLSTLNILDASSWIQQATKDDNVIGTDANFVRHDLGLPPAAG
jgi:hypothetical protein